MKASPRFREATAYIKLRHQPPQVKYPLLALHIAANPQAHDAAPLNVRPEVRNVLLTSRNLASYTKEGRSTSAFLGSIMTENLFLTLPAQYVEQGLCNGRASVCPSFCLSRR